eukprot:Opistho-2@64777
MHQLRHLIHNGRLTGFPKSGSRHQQQVTADQTCLTPASLRRWRLSLPRRESQSTKRLLPSQPRTTARGVLDPQLSTSAVTPSHQTSQGQTSLLSETLKKRTTSSSGEVIVGYKIGLSRDGVSASTASSELASPDGASFPCCSQMCDYRPQRLDKEELFTSFKNERGSAPGIVFELKTQVDNGPLLRTDYYKLVDGRRIKVSNEYHSKLHAYKNYKCTSHNLFFAVDLRSDSSATYNTHHMRINPFTQNPPMYSALI